MCVCVCVHPSASVCMCVCVCPHLFSSSDIESFVTFSERYKFYDHFGRPHTDRISALLGEREKVRGKIVNVH